MPQCVNIIFIHVFQLLPLHAYAFWYNVVPFSTVIIIQLGSEEILDPGIAKDYYGIMQFALLYDVENDK